MGYKVQLSKSADWLISIQDKDKHGWGLSSGQSVSIVNTAEAIYILSKSGKYPNEIIRGVNFIQDKLENSVNTNGKRTRYVFFALLGLLENILLADKSFIIKWSEWLYSARNKDGAWGHYANDENSALFPTCMSLIVLNQSNIQNHDLTLGYNWILSEKKEDGWSFGKDSSISEIATAMAVLTLRGIKDSKDSIFEKPKVKILQNDLWSTERENQPGTLWEHCSYMWIFPALMSLDVDPYNKVIANGVRNINKYNSNDGWIEPGGGMTVRGQFWAVVAFESIIDSYDPSVDTYQIDSSISQNALREPQFVNIFIHSNWAMIIPAKLYKLLTYLLLILDAMFFLGIHRLIEPIGRWLDFTLAVIFFLIIYKLVNKRKSLFSKSILPIIIGTVTILGTLDLVFGISVYDLFNIISELRLKWIPLK